MKDEKESLRIARMLEIRPISACEWRIADRYEDENSATKVIGFVQESAGRFECTRIGSGMCVDNFDSFEAALAYFAGDDQSSADSLSRRPPRDPT